MPIVDNSQSENEAYCLPRDNGRVRVPVIDKLNGSVTSCTQTCFPFYNFPNWIPFSFHGPYHRQAALMGWNRANRYYFPMFTRDVVRQFFAHSSKEVFAVRLQEGLFKSHGVRISDYIRKDVTAKKSKWMGFAEVSSGGLENVVLTGLDRRGKGCSVRK